MTRPPSTKASASSRLDAGIASAVEAAATAVCAPRPRALPVPVSRRIVTTSSRASSRRPAASTSSSSSVARSTPSRVGLGAGRIPADLADQFAVQSRDRGSESDRPHPGTARQRPDVPAPAAEAGRCRAPRSAARQRRPRVAGAHGYPAGGWLRVRDGRADARSPASGVARRHFDRGNPQHGQIRRAAGAPAREGRTLPAASSGSPARHRRTDSRRRSRSPGTASSRLVEPTEQPVVAGEVEGPGLAVPPREQGSRARRRREPRQSSAGRRFAGGSSCPGATAGAGTGGPAGTPGAVPDKGVAGEDRGQVDVPAPGRGQAVEQDPAGPPRWRSPPPARSRYRVAATRPGSRRSRTATPPERPEMRWPSRIDSTNGTFCRPTSPFSPVASVRPIRPCRIDRSAPGRSVPHRSCPGHWSP